MLSTIKPVVQIFITKNKSQKLILKQKSLPVSLPLLSTSKNTIENMLDTIKTKGKAAGLAAPQIGINERIIICSFTGDANDLEIMVNPTYINNGTIKEEGWEGCFSIPLTFAKVSRWEDIEVSYYRYKIDDDTISTISKQLNGFSARVFQHECDHLDGVLMTEQTSEIKTFSTEEEFNDFLQVVRKEREATIKEPSCSSPKCNP